MLYRKIKKTWYTKEGTKTKIQYNNWITAEQWNEKISSTVKKNNWILFLARVR